jgi:2',3'-cyclic-nucleotide 2'-phosphodiesterase/3'-nucleotidase
MTPYSFDVLQGASYRLDPTAAVGSRVKELRFRGKAVRDDDVFSLAVNSYRAQGAGGYAALRGRKVLRTYNDEVRELLVERLRVAGTVHPVTDRNWVLAPDAVWDSLEPAPPAPPVPPPAPAGTTGPPAR